MSETIVFLGRHDWANICNRIARAINRCEEDLIARVVTQCAHPFEYTEDIVIDRSGDDPAAEVLARADWIIHAGDGDYRTFDRLRARFSVRGVKLATCHAGTAFRQDPNRYNREDRERGFLRRFVGNDLYRLVQDDPTARIFMPPIDDIAESLTQQDFSACHSPSSRETKGTETIYQTATMLQIPIEIIEGVSYRRCEQRRRQHSVLVDQLHPDMGGYGAAALEALARGMAVVSNICDVVPAIDRWIPRPPILHAPHPGALAAHLCTLQDNPSYLQMRRRASLDWAQQYLSSEFTYRYWKAALSVS